MKRIAFSLVLILLLAASVPIAEVLADDASLPRPEGPVILTVRGAIGEPNTPAGAEPAARLDRALLERLPQSTVQTTTPWTEGLQRFEGVRLLELLRLLKAKGTVVSLGALNDYRVTMDLRQYAPFNPLLALKHNGDPMRIADKGPIWLVFPQDDYPELDQAGVHDLWVWQLREIVVR